MKKRWKVAKKVDDNMINLGNDINPITAQLLYNRGIVDGSDVRDFLFPDYKSISDPFLFPDINKIIDKIKDCIDRKDKITVYGDYDADGVTSSVVLVSSLKRLGAECDSYIPDRSKEGYGLNKSAIEDLVKSGTKLIITVDCGISNYDEVEFAKSVGVDVIVTDHHHIPEKIPDCLIINPNLEDDYPSKTLAGVGVAFKLSQALLKNLGNGEFSSEAFEKWLLDLVAIGTIADCVPLIGENRVLTKFGLVVLNKTQRSGLRALMEKSSTSIGEVDSTMVSFRLSPRINAAGRMSHAKKSFDLLISDSLDSANNLVDELNEINSERQKVTEKTVRNIISNIGDDNKDNAIVVLEKDCPIGIVGLVAGRISDFYGKPSFIATEQNGKITGSGRSVPEFNVINFLEEISDLFLRFGGHAQACGFTIKDKELFGEFKNKALEISNREIGGRELMPILNIDAEIKLSNIDWGFWGDIEKFSPFGQENQRPVFLTRNLKVLSSREVGQNGNHLKVFVNNHLEDVNCSLDCIGFGLSQYWRGKLNPGDLIDLVYHIDENRWNGNRDIQLKILDLKHSE